MGPWSHNEFGAWCPSCGELVARGDCDEDGFIPDECRVCGFPDDIEMMAQFHCGEEGSHGD